MDVLQKMLGNPVILTKLASTIGELVGTYVEATLLVIAEEFLDRPEQTTARPASKLDTDHDTGFYNMN